MSGELHIPDKAYNAGAEAAATFGIAEPADVAIDVLRVGCPLAFATELRRLAKAIVNEVHTELAGEEASAYEDGVLDAAGALFGRADELDPAGAES